MAFSHKKLMLALVVICLAFSGGLTRQIRSSGQEAVTVGTEETITDDPSSPAKDRVFVHLRNFVGDDLSVDCKKGDKEMGRRTLKDQEGLSISFKPKPDETTSVWCDMSWHGKNRRFPVYGDGAERENNVVDVFGYGIFINKMQFAKFS